MTRPALAAARALQVIDLFVTHPDAHFNLTEISRRTGINSASAHALLNVMLRSGYLQRHPERKTYALGPSLVVAGTAALRHLDGIRAAQQEIDGLSEAVALEVVITTVAGDDILVVAKSTYSSPYGASISAGQRLTMAPPIGSVFLAWSSSAEVERWLARSQSLSEDERSLQRSVLDVVRTRGYAIAFETALRRSLAITLAQPDDDHAANAVALHLDEMVHSPYHLTVVDPDSTYDVGMIAAPVFDSNGSVVAAITLSGFNPGTSGRDVLDIGERLSSAARLITKRSGGRMPSA